MTTEPLVVARRGVYCGIFAAIATTGLALAAHGVPPLWAEAVRWFMGGVCFAFMLVNFASYRDIRRAMRRGEEAKARLDKAAAEFAEAVSRELKKHGIEAEVEDISTDDPRIPGAPTRH